MGFKGPGDQAVMLSRCRSDSESLSGGSTHRVVHQCLSQTLLRSLQVETKALAVSGVCGSL